MTLATTKCDRRLGHILTEQRILTQQSLTRALQYQEKNRSSRFGDFLVENKMFRRDEIENTLKQAENNPHIPKEAKIGEILTASGLISLEKLQKALFGHEKIKKEKLGSILVRNGLVSEEQLFPALAKSLNIPFIDLDTEPPSLAATKKISKHLAAKMGVVPVELSGRTLVVATTDPCDLLAEKYLRFSTGCTIKMVFASSQQILNTQKKIYNVDKHKVATLLMEMADDVDVIKEDVEVIEDGVEVDIVKETDPVVIRLVNKILLASVAKQATDIHFEPGVGDLKIRYRVAGECHLAYEIPVAYKNAVLSRIKKLANLDIAEKRKPQSGKILLKFQDNQLEYRIETTPTVDGQEDAVLRAVARLDLMPLDKLGFSATNLKKFKALLSKPQGLILCVGPTGSGKTTCLHAALSYINGPNHKIWTAEDPVEITQPGLRQVQINQQTGLTFNQALRSFLRADSDVIMIGEMCDPETVKMTIDASLAGHLMFSTLPTNNAAETVNHLLKTGLDPRHFVDALLAILAQRLVPKLCDHCKQPYTPDHQEYEELIKGYGPAVTRTDILPAYSEQLTLMRRKGCSQCNGTGYHGCTGLYELLVGSGQLMQLIANRQAVSEGRYMTINDGLRPLRMDGIQKVFQGITDYEQVLKVCV